MRLLFVLSFAVTLFCTPSFGKPSRIRVALEALKDVEPTVEETQQQALKFFQVHPDKVNAMRAGASWKAIVPYFEVQGGGTAAGIGETTLLDEYSSIVIDENTTFEQNQPWVKRSSTGQAGELRVRMAWNLPNLLFNPEELDVSSLMVAQKDVISSITQLYYERRRLQLTLLANPPEETAALLTLEMRVEELTARLAGMTGGWFQQEIDAAFDEEELEN